MGKDYYGCMWKDHCGAMWKETMFSSIPELFNFIQGKLLLRKFAFLVLGVALNTVESF